MSAVLKDKVAIITGAGRGIGRVFALRFAEEGAKLLIPDIDLEMAEKTVKEVKSKGGEAVAIKTDISDENATQKMAEKVIQQYGRVDILINNAAYNLGVGKTPWDGWTVKEWDRMFAVNVRGIWLCCKAIAPLMIKESKGKIINMSSDIIKIPPSQSGLALACTKAAINTLTQTLARALGPSGINVNAIAPGRTATEATLSQTGEKAFQATIAGQCIKRREEPTDIAGTAVFLASEDSDFITGQVIIVDGGSVMV